MGIDWKLLANAADEQQKIDNDRVAEEKRVLAENRQKMADEHANFLRPLGLEADEWEWHDSKKTIYWLGDDGFSWWLTPGCSVLSIKYGSSIREIVFQDFFILDDIPETWSQHHLRRVRAVIFNILTELCPEGYSCCLGCDKLMSNELLNDDHVCQSCVMNGQEEVIDMIVCERCKEYKEDSGDGMVCNPCRQKIEGGTN